MPHYDSNAENFSSLEVNDLHGVVAVCGCKDVATLSDTKSTHTLLSGIRWRSYS